MASGIYGRRLVDRLTFSLQHPHVRCMAQWQPPPREPPKTKAELREMLAEAVRNTQPEPERPPKIKRDRD